jgi:hypothetical protein
VVALVSPSGGHSPPTARPPNHHFTTPPVPEERTNNLTKITNNSAQRNSTTTTHRSANHAHPATPPADTATGPDANPTDDSTDPAGTTESSDTDPASQPGPGAPARRSRRVAGRAARRVTDRRGAEPSETARGAVAAAVPTPEQWAHEQLKHAPARSRAWGRKVAAIYGYDVPQE